MKYLLCTLACLLSLSAYGQLQIEGGAQIVVSGAPILVVQDLDWQQNGNVIPAQSEVIFRGGASAISGTGASFHRLTLDKGGAGLQLQTSISVDDELRFTQGSLDLNGQEISLGTTGSLVNESEAHRAFNSGAATARILAVRDLNAPSQANPANLGLLITSAANLGSTSLSRHFAPQSVGAASGIERYYIVVPTNNSGLNATLRFTYFDAELNGAGESDLEAFLSSDNGLSYAPLGFTSRDANANFVEFAGVDQLPAANRLTLAEFSATSFPVEWLGFTATAVGARVQCRWETATELNSDYFVVERSVDGLAFASFATLPAAGNSQDLRSYEAWDEQPYLGRSWYRVRQVDPAGGNSYTPWVRWAFSPPLQPPLAPNPATELTTLSLQALDEGPLALSLYDAKGRLVQLQQQRLASGLNRIEIDVRDLSEGVYYIVARQGGQQLRLPLMVL